MKKTTYHRVRWDPRLARSASGVPLTGEVAKRNAERRAFVASVGEWMWGELVWVPDGVGTHCRRANGLHATVFRYRGEKEWSVRLSGFQGQNPTWHGGFGTAAKARAGAYDLMFPFEAEVPPEAPRGERRGLRCLVGSFSL